MPLTRSVARQSPRRRRRRGIVIRGRVVLPSCLIKLQAARRTSKGEKTEERASGWMVGVHIYAHLFIATGQGVPGGLLPEDAADAI